VKRELSLRDAVNKTTPDQIYMVYETEVTDPPKNWLYEGLSHECSHVFQLKYADVLRPFKTRCGIHVTTHIDKTTAKLFNLVKVDTTCVWCVSGKVRE
jgi:hypothetical protein